MLCILNNGQCGRIWNEWMSPQTCHVMNVWIGLHSYTLIYPLSKTNCYIQCCYTLPCWLVPFASHPRQTHCRSNHLFTNSPLYLTASFLFTTFSAWLSIFVAMISLLFLFSQALVSLSWYWLISFFYVCQYFFFLFSWK